MNNEKQDIDPRERLLDALNDPETSPEEWEELLSEEDNIQTLHLLRDCRRLLFVRMLLPKQILIKLGTNLCKNGKWKCKKGIAYFLLC